MVRVLLKGAVSRVISASTGAFETKNTMISVASMAMTRAISARPRSRPMIDARVGGFMLPADVAAGARAAGVTSVVIGRLAFLLAIARTGRAYKCRAFRGSGPRGCGRRRRCGHGRTPAKD